MKEKVSPTTKDAPEFVRVWSGWGFLTEVYSKHIHIHTENEENEKRDQFNFK